MRKCVLILVPIRSPCIVLNLLVAVLFCDLRTRQLDAWFRDVCFFYRDMPAPAREAVRLFLHFDLKASKDAFVHDQLAWGTIEPNKEADAPIMILRKSTVVNLHDSCMDPSVPEPVAELGKQKSLRYNLKEPVAVASNKATVASAKAGTGGGAILAPNDIRSMNGSILQSQHSGRKANSVA